MTARSLLAAAASAFVLLPAAANAAPVGQLAETCAPAGGVGTLCYAGDIAIRDAQSIAQPDRFEPGLQAYEASWTHHALAFQYKLANDVGFVNAPWVGTHNSFNSIAQLGPALSSSDANQQLKLVDQLRMDMRSLEIDVHWFPSVHANGANAPVVCHGGATGDHDGCTVEPLLDTVLDDVAGWLHGHRDQVILLYLEDHLSGGGYDPASAIINDKLGSMVYGTGGNGSCVQLPKTLTRNAVLAAGKQVVIVGNGQCGEGTAWRKLAFNWSDHKEERPHGFPGFPKCGPPFTRDDYDNHLIRYYEDSTGLTNGASQFGAADADDGLTPATTKALVRCGVDLLGFDQLQPGDGRNDAAVWSWAQDQPARGSCAELRGDGRWYSDNCNSKQPAACRTATGWAVTDKAVKAKSAASACAATGAKSDAPRTGYDNESLKSVTGGTTVWLGLTRTRDGWVTT
jgi:hypothetical protein